MVWQKNYFALLKPWQAGKFMLAHSSRPWPSRTGQSYVSGHGNFTSEVHLSLETHPPELIEMN
jgi:hypothetical protein